MADSGTTTPPGRTVDPYSRVAAKLRYAGLTPDDIPRGPGSGAMVTPAEVDAEIARRGLTVNLPDELPPMGARMARRYVRQLLGWDAHLMRLREGTKTPVEFRWEEAPALTEDEATHWLTVGGNLGILAGRSGSDGWLVLDAGNPAAGSLLQAAGLTPTVMTPNAQDPTSPMAGGCHIWLPLPAGVDRATLKARLSVPLQGGGILDALVGTRYTVAPGSRLTHVPGFRYEFAGEGAAFNPKLWGADDIHWLLDPSVPAPNVPGLDPLRGVAHKLEHPRRVPSADTDPITAAVDSISWEVWRDNDPRVQILGTDGSCFCDVFHWAGDANPRSGILHDGCAHGYMAHIYSTTLLEKIGAERVSRLRFAALLRGVTTREGVVELAAEHGIQLGRNPRGITLGDIAVAHPTPTLQVLPGGDAGESTEAGADPAPARRLSAVPRIGTVTGTAGGAEPETEPARVAAPVETAPTHDAFQGVESDEDDDDTGHATFRRLDEIGDDEFWNSLPILRKVHRAALANGVYPWGLLGAVLPRIACTIPPNVRLVGSSGKPGGPESGGSLNLNSILLGSPEAGKSETIKLAADLVRLPDHACEVPPGTGEGIIKSFGYFKRASGKRDGDGGDTAADPVIPAPAAGVSGAPPADVPAIGSVPSRSGAANANGYEYQHITDTVLVVAGEIADVVAEAQRQGTKLMSILRSMWVGEQVGTTTGEVERRTQLRPQSYRFGSILGAQVDLDTLGTIFEQGKLGTAQRFGFFPVKTMPATGDPITVINLPVIDWSNGSPAAEKIGTMLTGPQPVWISRPQSAHEEIEAYKVKKQTTAHLPFSVDYARQCAEDEESLDSLSGHELFHQLKFAAVLAVGCGEREPTDLHWWAAGRIMQAREVVIRSVAKVLAVQREGADRKTGRSRGRAQAVARRAEAEAEDEYRKEIAQRIYSVVSAKGEPMSAAEVGRALGRQNRVVREILESMAEGGSLHRVGLNQRGNQLYWITPGTATAAG